MAHRLQYKIFVALSDKQNPDVCLNDNSPDILAYKDYSKRKICKLSPPIRPVVIMMHCVVLGVQSNSFEQ